MKNLVIAMMVLLSTAGIAQEKRNHMHAERPQFTPEQQTELIVKKLTLELDLSDKQQNEIQQITSKRQTLRNALRKEIVSKRAENKKLTSDEKFVLKSKALDAQIAHKKEMKKILSSEQFEKWEKIQEKDRKKNRMKMKRNPESKN